MRSLFICRQKSRFFLASSVTRTTDAGHPAGAEGRSPEDSGGLLFQNKYETAASLFCAGTERKNSRATVSRPHLTKRICEIFFPIVFKTSVKGAAEMNYKIETKEAFRIIGVSAPLDKEIENHFI